MAIGANDIGSEAWCAAMSEVLAELDLPEVQATVEQRIGDGNGGPVMAYRLVLDSGRAHLAPAPPNAGTADGGSSELSGRDGEDEDLGISDGNGVVMMSQSRKTAEAVRQGELGALAALQAGLIKVSGDVRVLIAASEALALVNAALGQALADDGSRVGDTASGTDGAAESVDGAEGPGDDGN